MTSRTIVFVAFHASSASTTIGPFEVFKYADECLIRAGRATDRFQLAVVSPDDRAVRCEGFVTLTPTAKLADLAQIDLLFLSGMSLAESDDVMTDFSFRHWLATQHAGGAEIAAVCAGQALLAEAGMLDGRTTAIHWSLFDDFTRRWPAARWTADRLVVEDTGIYSSCGATSAVDLALYLVDRYCGLEVMMECARWFVTDPPRTHPGTPPPLIAASRGLDPAMERIEAWLHAHFCEDVRFEALAAQFGMSWRSFHRHFVYAFGDPPKTYLQKLRLAAARRLLETGTLAIDQVARRVGYDNPAFFRALFKRYCGMTPSDYRQSFRFRDLSKARSSPAA